jgi:large subunit ribosomal protein L21
MYAIVEIAGQQFKVEQGKKIFVHRLEAAEGNQIEFNQVLLIEDEGKITVGEPIIPDAIVEGKVLDHMRGDKVIVFKKKRKKGYRVKNGHRQNFTQVEIISINGKSAPVLETTKKVKVKASEESITEEPLTEKKPAEKKSTAKKTAVKKVVEKIADEEKPKARKTTKKKE